MDLATNPLTPHRLRKLRTMPASEMAYRGWQEASKWLSRLAPSDRPIDPEKFLRSRAPLLADPRAALTAIRDRAPHRFFAGATDPDLATELEVLFPGETDAIIAAADRAMHGGGSPTGPRQPRRRAVVAGQPRNLAANVLRR